MPRIYNDNQENKLRKRIWSMVPWDPEPRMAVLGKTSTNLPKVNQRRLKNMVMGPARLETKNGSAREHQPQRTLKKKSGVGTRRWWLAIRIKVENLRA
jgi:hypothetical protein